VSQGVPPRETLARHTAQEVGLTPRVSEIADIVALLTNPQETCRITRSFTMPPEQHSRGTQHAL
jgi:hypothetical protein